MCVIGSSKQNSKQAQVLGTQLLVSVIKELDSVVLTRRDEPSNLGGVADTVYSVAVVTGDRGAGLGSTGVP